MDEYPAPGLTADWLNAWLAAIGVTVLLPDARLRWTNDPLPQAVFHLPDDSDPLPDLIAAALPTVDDHRNLTIADLPRRVKLDTFRSKACVERSTGGWSLASSLTDLAEARDDEATHGPLDPPAPRGETLYTRLVACRSDLNNGAPKKIEASLLGMATRRSMNGLGFDFRRLSPGTNAVDPAVECLAFEALRLFPTRGNGRVARQRGWTSHESQRGAFRWPAWKPPLDHWAIDGLLDSFQALGYRADARTRLGVTATFHSVPYRKKTEMDSTRGYASERIW